MSSREDVGEAIGRGEFLDRVEYYDRDDLQSSIRGLMVDDVMGTLRNHLDGMRLHLLVVGGGPATEAFARKVVPGLMRYDAVTLLNRPGVDRGDYEIGLASNRKEHFYVDPRVLDWGRSGHREQLAQEQYDAVFVSGVSAEDPIVLATLAGRYSLVVIDIEGEYFLDLARQCKSATLPAFSFIHTKVGQKKSAHCAPLFTEGTRKDAEEYREWARNCTPNNSLKCSEHDCPAKKVGAAIARIYADGPPPRVVYSFDPGAVASRK